MSLEVGKSLLTTVALLLAAVQLWSMAEVRGLVRLFPVETRILVKLHRWGGAAALGVVLLVGMVCLYAVFAERYGLYTPRLQVHAVLGFLAAVVLASKVLIANRFRHCLRFALPLGLTAALLLLGTFVFSALWWFLRFG